MRKAVLLPAYLCRSLVWFPLWMAVLALSPRAALIPCSVLLAACTGLCMLWKRFCSWKFAKNPKIALCLSLFIALPACFGTALLLQKMHCEAASAFFITALSVLTMQIGADKPAEHLFSSTGYAAFLTGDVISACLLLFGNRRIPMAELLSVISIVSGSYLLLRNQLMLLRLVNRRSKTDTEVPKDILRGNLMMVLGIFLTALLIFLFRTPLLHLLTWMCSAAKAMCSAIIQGCLRVLAWMDRNETGMIQPEEESGGMPPPAVGKMSPLWMLMWIPFVMIVYIVWREFLSDWVELFRDWIWAFIQRMRGKDVSSAKLPIPKHVEFSDTETVVHRRKRRSQKQREWRRRLRAWKRLPDQPEKFYVGYRLLLEAPAWADTTIRGADTVQEIRAKWAASHEPAQALDAVTAAYHADRYAEQGLPETAVSELTAVLNQLK